MTWEQRYRLRQTARTSLVLWAGIALVAALAVAPAVRWLDRETGWKLFDFSPDGARAVLSALVGSMLTFIVFVLSATLIVVQLASGQWTPRVIRLVLATPGVKIALGILTFAFTYTLAALGRVEARVPDLHVGVAVLLNLASIMVFFLFVQRLSSALRPASLVQLVADQAEQVIDQVYPTPLDPKRAELPERQSLPAPANQEIEFTGRSGVVMAFSAARLARAARDADVAVELVPQVGDFVAPGDSLFRVAGGAKPIVPEVLRGCVAVGPERTLEQDPRFVFRILVDIANKALSPAINDPTTAVQALDQIQRLLFHVGRRALDDGQVRDRDGKLRLVYGTPNWPDFVMLAVSEVRHYGSGSLQVDRRLRAMLKRLIDELPEARRPPLEAELALLRSAVERSFEDQEDRKRANVADYQGVGSSET
ncbi:MAG TPA: DUF2254 domain-containing protein [Gemmataceae bacterium]|nr:DUF2254 domain-containing protein [Gemmataceae bacterium]